MFKSVVLKSGIKAVINMNNVEMILERSEKEVEIMFVSSRSIIVIWYEDLKKEGE
jgi:hypothetical protein